MSTKKRSTNTSRRVSKREFKDVEELVLPNSKLKFCSEQLHNLNYIFTTKLTEAPNFEYAKALLLAKSVSERLIQRLICGVGVLDSRFSTKFLIPIHESPNDNLSQVLKYMYRLDTLSKPSLYQSDPQPKYSITENDAENCPPGYARIRLHSSCSRTWADFINSSGFLRRDKVQARVVELLALAATGDTPNSPLMIDESVLCGSPGKITDPLSLHYILERPSNEHVFYGAPGAIPRFPDPRDYKLAIVDEPEGIRLRIGFLSPALTSIAIEVRLIVAIGLNVWPSSTNFPFRVPLGHSDCVLYHKAAQTGMYLTGFGVHSSAWQIRAPAAELLLENHHNQNSTITKILKILFYVLKDLNNEYRRYHFSYKILKTYALRTELLYELEKDSSAPTETILKWSPKYLSTHVLKILDNLIEALKNQKQPNYFFPGANLFINPGHLCDDDFTLESNKIHAYLLKVFDESLMSFKSDEEFSKFLIGQKTEMTLLYKWKDLVDGLLPPPSTRGRRICFAGSKYKRDVVYTQYTTRQLEYIGILIKNMLMVKQNVLQTTEEFVWIANFKLPEGLPENPIEDVIYIVVTLLEQARDKFLETLPENSNLSKSKIKRKFNLATTKLIEIVRKEQIETLQNLDDGALVKTILKWLYKGLDQNKKSLAPVLRPYLRVLFVASHGASWHLEAIKNKEALDEIGALGKFSQLVNNGAITPAQGLVESVNKNWEWAKNMLKMIEADNLRLVFISGRGKVIKHFLSLPENEKKIKDSNKSLDSLIKYPEWSSLTRRHYLKTILGKSLLIKELNGNFDDLKSPYCNLREASSMTLGFSQLHRRGEHRCCGDVLQALVAMQKANVVQEVSGLLPDEERLEISEALQKLTSKRTLSNKKKSNTFIHISSNSRRKINPEKSVEEKQTYTAKEESAGIKEEEKKKEKFASKRWNKESVFNNADNQQEGTLIGSCRAARIKDDTNIIHFQDNFKIQSLMKHSSFKY